MKPVVIRPSSLNFWMGCEKAGVHAFFNPQETPQHISAWVGTKAHKRLFEDEEAELAPTEAYAYDAITPSAAHAVKQVKRIVKKVKNLDELDFIDIDETECLLPPFQKTEWGPSIVAQGTADIVGQFNGTPIILDLKTSEDTDNKASYKTWLQLGAYALMLGKPNTQIGVVHASRKNVGAGIEEPYIIWHKRPELIMHQSIKVMDRIAELINNPEKATVSPGIACTWCMHDGCPIRAISSTLK